MQNSVPLAKDEVQDLQQTHSQEMLFSKDGNVQSRMYNELSFIWKRGIGGKFILGIHRMQRSTKALYIKALHLQRGMVSGIEDMAFIV